MKILKVISLLLDYPNETLIEAQDELKQAIYETRYISPQQRQALDHLLQYLTSKEVMQVQSNYLDLFERGRQLSLFLFEHVHGESRDRGQAMVDLLAQYEAAGFEISAKELPDYIPLYLEYLATQETIKVHEGLADIEHLLALLGARLQQRSSPYVACFEALLQMAGTDPQQAISALQAEVSQESTTQTLEELDDEWEEEAVTFMGDDATSSCSQQTTQADGSIPIHWVDFDMKQRTSQNV